MSNQALALVSVSVSAPGLVQEKAQVLVSAARVQVAQALAQVAQVAVLSLAAAPV
jgi:hypothetical protein